MALPVARPVRGIRSWRRARWSALGLIAIVVVSIWSVSHTIASKRYREELAQAEKDYNAGYYVLAQRRLAALEAAWPGESEVSFQFDNGRELWRWRGGATGPR